MGIGCKIIKDFKRPSKELVEKFKGIPVANVDDCMNRTAAVRFDIEPIGSGYLVGPAFTVKVPQGDNLMLHAAMDLAKPGDVIVIDAGGFKDRAIFGELMARYCQRRGIKGMVCYGAIRDREDIKGLKDFPVYACGCTPNGPYKNGPGEINVSITIGDKIVNPGDIVIGDDDGVLFIHPDNAEEILQKAKKVIETEANLRKLIMEKCSYERPWVNEKLKKIGCEIIG